jgi:hypothetical protein
MRRHHGLPTLGIVLLTVLILVVEIQGWRPPFPFRPGQIPQRDITCRTPFQIVSLEDTQVARERAKWEVPHVYSNDPQPLIELRDSLRRAVVAIVSADKYEDCDKELWDQFRGNPDDTKAIENQDSQVTFQTFRKTFEEDPDLKKFLEGIRSAFTPFEKRGLLRKLQHEPGEGNQDTIVVFPIDHPEQRQTIEVGDVLIGNGSSLHEQLREQLGNPLQADLIFRWIRKRIPETLTEDVGETLKAQRAASNAVGPVLRRYEESEVLVEGGTPLREKQLFLLRAEYASQLENRSLGQNMLRMLGVGGLIFALFLFAGSFNFYRERRRPTTLLSFSGLMGMMVSTVLVAVILHVLATDQGSLELIPLLIFAQCLAITYSRELAMTLTMIVAFTLTLAFGQHLETFVLLMGTASAIILQLGRLRSRSKLITVGCFGGLFAFLLTIALGILNSQPLNLHLMSSAALNAVWSVSAGFIMSGLLPFIERPFGILTDMSLLELGDVSHPLLQELIRRAPATYNHSITVGSIAEAAADKIGARGLLTRVGAYFHDIGKILKPNYFTENQVQGQNLHETLEPRMSALVIVAHVKDGADLARQHHLPGSILDLIEQHHGTTLVSYFYTLASRQQKENYNLDSTVAEGTFRYPGPKPKSKEAGILMLADAAESACRSLNETTPGKIENLVRQVTEQKLEDGQFDECGLTLMEIREVENSVINSLIAIHHSRIRYPVVGKSETGKIFAKQTPVVEITSQETQEKQSENATARDNLAAQHRLAGNG